MNRCRAHLRRTGGTSAWDPSSHAAVAEVLSPAPSSGKVVSTEGLAICLLGVKGFSSLFSLQSLEVS